MAYPWSAADRTLGVNFAEWRWIDFYNRFAGRSALLAYASEKNIPVQQTAAKPWSTGVYIRLHATARATDS